MTKTYDKIRRPWTIQRCIPTNSTAETGKVSTFFQMDYMGSAEYEFGAIPECLRDMHGKLSLLQIFTIRVKDKSVFVLCTTEQLPEYRTALEDLGNEEYGLLKHSIPGYYRQINEQSVGYAKDTLWIDLGNAVAFSLDRKQLETFQSSVPLSVKYMDEQKALRPKS